MSERIQYPCPCYCDGDDADSVNYELIFDVIPLYDWWVVKLGGNDGFSYHLVWATFQFEVLPNLGFHICTEVVKNWYSVFWIFGVWLEPRYCSFKILLPSKETPSVVIWRRRFLFRLAYLNITSVAPNLVEGSFVQFSSYWNFPFILWQYFQICIPRL